MSQPSEHVVPLPTPGSEDELEAVWSTEDIAKDFQVSTSLPSDALEHRLAILDIVDADGRAGEDMIGETISISEYVIHPCKVRSRTTGELLDALRTVFPQDDGRPVQFVSAGVIKEIQKLSWAVGKLPPWYPPIRVKIKQVGTRAGGRTYKLVLQR